MTTASRHCFTYRRNLSRITSETVRPSARAFSCAARHRSSSTRIVRCGVFPSVATSGRHECVGGDLLSVLESVRRLVALRSDDQNLGAHLLSGGPDEEERPHGVDAGGGGDLLAEVHPVDDLLVVPAGGDVVEVHGCSPCSFRCVYVHRTPSRMYTATRTFIHDLYRRLYREAAMQWDDAHPQPEEAP